jgi:hypothetical protein
MFDINPGTGWLFFAYATGTLFGMWTGFKIYAAKGAELTIDTLIEGGYLKTRKGTDGEIEILKYDEE